MCGGVWRCVEGVEVYMCEGSDSVDVEGRESGQEAPQHGITVCPCSLESC